MAARGDVRLTLRTSFSLLLGAGNLRIRPMVLMLAAAFACELNAQGVPNAGQVLDSLHELQQIPSRPESESLQFDLPAPAKILPPAGNDATGDRHLTIKSFQLEGNTLFSDETLQMLLADGLDKPLTLRQTEYLVARLGAYYRERGYVLASAYIPQQQISDGRMRVVIMEGVLGEVKLAIAPGVRLSPSRIARVMAALPAGQPIHVPTVERVLLLLNDMPGISVHSTLQAGSSKGSADLVVNVTQTGIGRGWMGIDNFGSRYTGTLRASAGVQLNDLLGIGDQLSLVGIHAFDDINSMRADYEFPLGAEGLRLRFGYSRTAYGIGDVFAPLGLTGKVEAASMGLQYPLLRSRERNLGLFAGTEYRRMAENTAAFGVDVNKNVTNGTFRPARQRG